MAAIRVSTVIDARPAAVWKAVEDVASHVRWMHDAVEIRFTSSRRSGVGAAFECDTQVGPFRLTDVMEITEWRPRRAMGVRHVGVVTGSGVFTLRRLRGGRTRFTWSERLEFPWWMGGPLGAVVGGQVMRLVWRRNLRTLKQLVEEPRADRRGPDGGRLDRPRSDRRRAGTARRAPRPRLGACSPPPSPAP